MQLVSVRPGERIYAGDVDILRYEKRRMTLKTASGEEIDIVVNDAGDLDGDPLCGPPSVSVTDERIWNPRQWNPLQRLTELGVSYDAYFYRLENTILLVLK